MSNMIYVYRDEEGNWWRLNERGVPLGGACYYTGEDAAVLDKLLLKEPECNGSRKG